MGYFSEVPCEFRIQVTDIKKNVRMTCCAFLIDRCLSRVKENEGMGSGKGLRVVVCIEHIRQVFWFLYLVWSNSFVFPFLFSFIFLFSWQAFFFVLQLLFVSLSILSRVHLSVAFFPYSLSSFFSLLLICFPLNLTLLNFFCEMLHFLLLWRWKRVFNCQERFTMAVGLCVNFLS